MSPNKNSIASRLFWFMLTERQRFVSKTMHEMVLVALSQGSSPDPTMNFQKEAGEGLQDIKL